MLNVMHNGASGDSDDRADRARSPGRAKKGEAEEAIAFLEDATNLELKVPCRRVNIDVCSEASKQQTPPPNRQYQNLHLLHVGSPPFQAPDGKRRAYAAYA